MKHEIHYITTDLELIAPHDLAPLADELTHRDIVAFHGQYQNGSWFARCNAGKGSPEPDMDIAAMLTAIESLEEPSRSLWTACTIRDFDIGYDCGDEPWSFRQQLLPATLVRIAQAGAGVVITIYPVIETDAAEAALDILKKDKWIKSRIGKYNGHGYHHTDSSSLKKNQAEVKLTLHGKKGSSIYVHCHMELSTEGEWELKEILKKEERFYPLCT